MTGPVLETRGLIRRFGGLTAVDDVSLSVPKGQIRALIGPNGAGKTTLVSLISGRIPPSAGRVFFEGRDVTALPAHRRIRAGMAYTFQITSVFARLSARENVRLAAHRRGSAAGRDAVETALSRTGILDRADQVAGDLAYGHQRLLEIAMGLVRAPRLLILDEPTQGLAQAEVAAFNDLIRALDTTVLLIEHNMDVVMELAQVVTVLNFGAVLAEGPPDTIRSDASVQAAYLGGA